MEIQNTHSVAQISGITSAAFGFEMNAKMYDILISKMYTNKPAAVIRELSANAWDAHVEAGNVSKPFDLQLPSWMDKTFSIRDYGTGIPHDRFEHIYTNVGSSTKEGTNELIGGFGLGSKAPFTMTDTFIVENFRGGIKTTWVCFKDKGVPQVSCVGTEDTDEPNGLKVSFSFDDGEVAEFTKQTMEQLKYFPVKPNITGGSGTITFPPLPDGWDTKEYFFQAQDKSQSYYGSPRSYVVMGNVCYNIESRNFDYKYRSIFDTGVILKVPIGSVDIPPSRENIELTPRTMKTLNGVLDKIGEDYAEEAMARIKLCTTIMETRKICVDLNWRLLSREFRETVYLGRTLTEHGQVSFQDVAGYLTYYVERKRRSSNYSYSHKWASTTKYRDGELVFCVNDLGKNQKAHIENNASQLLNHASGNLVILHVDIGDLKTYEARVAQAVLEVTNELGAAPLLLSSIIGPVPAKVPKTASVTKRMPPNQVFKLTGVEGGYSIMKHAEKYDGDEPEGYFLEISGATVKTDVQQMKYYLDNGLMGALDKPVYLVRSTTVPKLTKLVRLDQGVIDKLKDTVTVKALEQEKISEAYGHTVHIRIPDEFIPNVKDRAVKVYIRYAKYVTKKRDEFFNKDVRQLARVLGANEALSKMLHRPNPKLEGYRTKIQDLNELFGQITSTYSEERRKARLAALRSLIN